MLNRRQFALAAAGGALLPAGPSAWASAMLQLTDTRIDVVSDGRLKLPGSFLYAGMPKAELNDILKRHDLSSGEAAPDCNLTLVRNGTQTILFDAGAGPNFMESAGKLSEALDAISVDPEDVTHVVFTHGHPDHLWGLLDDFDEPLFTNATYFMAEMEMDYWLNPNTVNTIGEARQAFAAGAMRNLKAIEDRITRFRNDEEILPGILARGTPGHTPGHTSFEIRSGNDAVMVVGDAIGNHHIAFERPDWGANSDQDKSMGAKTRQGLLDQIASQKMKMIGYHLPYPGIGYAEKKGAAYRWVST